MAEVSKSKKISTALQREIRKISAKREAWQEGTFKRSNEELYGILEECHKLLGYLRADREMRKQLTKVLEEEGIKVNANSSLEGKIVRAIFGVDNKRTFAYARVLRLANTQKPNDWSLAEWIEEKGGVEEIRRKPEDGPTPAEKTVTRRETAEKALSEIEAICPRFKPSASLQPSSDGDFAFSVALVRVDDDGQASIVFGSNKETLVKNVLNEAGKLIEEENELDAKLSKHSKKRKKRDKVLDGDEGEEDTLAALAG